MASDQSDDVFDVINVSHLSPSHSYSTRTLGGIATGHAALMPVCELASPLSTIAKNSQGVLELSLPANTPDTPANSLENTPTSLENTSNYPENTPYSPNRERQFSQFSAQDSMTSSLIDKEVHKQRRPDKSSSKWYSISFPGPTATKSHKGHKKSHRDRTNFPKLGHPKIILAQSNLSSGEKSKSKLGYLFGCTKPSRPQKPKLPSRNSDSPSLSKVPERCISSPNIRHFRTPDEDELFEVHLIFSLQRKISESIIIIS